jgi:hypothetical protein
MTNDLPNASGDGLPALGPSPLIAGENAAAYDDLVARVRGALQPRDILEDIWVRDVVDLAWEVLRLRRLKAQLMRVAARDGMSDVLGDLPIDDPCEVADRWHAGDAEAAAEVNQALAAAGLTIDAVMAQTLTERIGDIERIERMMTAAEARRDTILRELDRRRAGLAMSLRRAIREAEAAEFKLIASTQPEAAA